MVGRSGRGALKLLLTATLAGCAGDPIVPPAPDEPFVYIVLGHHTPSQVGNAFGQHAWLLQTGSVAEPAQFLEADAFDMRRASDGDRFDWRSYGLTGQLADPWAVSYEEANYRLPDTPSAAGLGSDSVVPGGRYLLEIVVGGDVITGDVTVPGAVAPVVIGEGGQAVVTWPRVTGAAGYQVVPSWAEPALVADTAYGLPPGGGVVAVEALDPNLWRYLTDDEVAASGITGAVGLFGALTRGIVTYGEASAPDVRSTTSTSSTSNTSVEPRGIGPLPRSP